MKKTLLGILVLLVFLKISTYLTGCTNQPTEADLERLRLEAVALNTAMVARLAKKTLTQNWQFVVQGQTITKKTLTLNLPQLKALATTSVWTKDPHNTSRNPNTIFHFRGIAISKLLKQVGVAPNVTDVTFIANDTYRVTVKLADLLKYPIIIALEKDNQPISLSDGGPLYFVFPYSKYPQLQKKLYPDRFWVFNLTNMVVGTEPIHLRVGDRILTASTLNKLQPITLEETVGYGIGWPVGKVKLQGVQIRDALTAAGISLPKGSSVIIRGKRSIYNQTTKPTSLEASELERCKIMLATHWGDNRQAILAPLGGPVTLALSSDCKTKSDDRRWITFVESLEVTK